MSLTMTITKDSTTVNLLSSPYSIVEEHDLGGVLREFEAVSGPTLDLPQFGPTTTSQPRLIDLTVFVTGTTADTLAEYVSDLLAVLPDDDTYSTLVVTPNGSSYASTLIARRVSGLVSKPLSHMETLSYKTVVSFTLACDPYVYGAAQTIIGGLEGFSEAPYGYAWPTSPPGTTEYAYASYGTGDGVISLRFDDGTAEDYSLTLPLLEARGLKAGFAITSSCIGSTSAYMTLAQIQKVASCGHEIMCHSASHGADPTTFSEFRAETLGAKQALEALGFVPQTFVQPGSWVGAYRIDDETWEMGCAADLFLREHFAAYEGYYQPNQRTLPIVGDYRYGASHASPVAYTGAPAYNAKNYIDLVITNGTGYELLFHSASIGGGGISLVDFEATLDYLVTKQTAGDITVLTPTQQLYAVAS